MSVEAMIVAMGVAAGVWGVSAWFIYRRARSGGTTKRHQSDADS